MTNPCDTIIGRLRWVFHTGLITSDVSFAWPTAIRAVNRLAADFKRGGEVSRGIT
jgi:hypothetical protein